MKNAMICLCAALAALFAGCFSIETAGMGALHGSSLTLHEHGGRPYEHVLVSNYGWYLFNRFPIACGNARKGARFPWAFFRDDVDETVLHGRLTDYAKTLDCDIADINMFNSEQVLLDIYSIPVPIPYVCCYREMQFSGILVKRPDAADDDAARGERMKREMMELLNRLPKEDER